MDCHILLLYLTANIVDEENVGRQEEDAGICSM